MRRHILEPESSFFLLWNYEHRLAYCPNAKTGTSTWMHVLLGLVPWLSSPAPATATQDDDWRGRFHAAAQRLFQMPMKWPGGKELFDLLFSFLFVRHPFVRLVSAYQDKVCIRTNPPIRSESELGRPIPDFIFGTRQRVSFLLLFYRLWIMPSMTFLIEVTKAETGRI